MFERCLYDQRLYKMISFLVIYVSHVFILLLKVTLSDVKRLSNILFRQITRKGIMFLVFISNYFLLNTIKFFAFQL